jgi:hypothetical protein
MMFSRLIRTGFMFMTNPPFMRKEYIGLLIAVNAAKANVKEAVRPYHRRDQPENRLKDANLSPS